MIGVTLDAGALVGIDRGSSRMLSLLDLARSNDRQLRVPAPVVAQVWRSGPRAARLARLLNSPDVLVVPLDGRRARAVGVLLANSGTSDVADGAVVVCAREFDDSVITSDPGDLRVLDPALELMVL
ncbi:MAG: hypothetical protein NVS3B26_11360 [Mycobacteriales bacterium]